MGSSYGTKKCHGIYCYQAVVPTGQMENTFLNLMTLPEGMPLA